MKYLVFFALLINPLTIREINSLKKEARDAFSKADYKTAIEKYSYLRDTLNVTDDAVLLNLAHAYFYLNDTANAISAYQNLTSAEASIRSKAYVQLGVIHNRQGAQEEALQYFKDAIKADPDNMDARYNYELLKKYMEYPEIILAKTRLLVKQRRYREARRFLGAKLQESKRMSQLKDYTDRIETIITIDSLGRL